MVVKRIRGITPEQLHGTGAFGDVLAFPVRTYGKMEQINYYSQTSVISCYETEIFHASLKVDTERSLQSCNPRTDLCHFASVIRSRFLK